jgi:hypothetical protein
MTVSYLAISLDGYFEVLLYTDPRVTIFTFYSIIQEAL